MRRFEILCPWCKKPMRVAVPADRLDWEALVVVFGIFIALPLAVMAAVVWGPR